MSNDTFYQQYGIQLASGTNFEVAERVMKNNYSTDIQEQFGTRFDQINQLIANGEAWAGLFRYVNFITEHHYVEAYAALESAHHYFTMRGFPAPNSPVKTIFCDLVEILNQGGWETFVATDTLHPIPSAIPGTGLAVAFWQLTQQTETVSVQSAGQSFALNLHSGL